MAVPVRRTLVLLQRTCAGLKDVNHYLPLLLPVRTKSRFYVPQPFKGKDSKQLSHKEMEAKARAAGLVYPKELNQRPIDISSTPVVFDPYLPPEGDARLSTVTKDGLKQKTQRLKQVASAKIALSTIKKHDTNFKTKEFANQAQEIFIEAHNALSSFNKETLHRLVTEKCYPEMTRGNRLKTIRWSFNGSLDPPKIVHVTCSSMVNKENLYGQVTVRMHSRQTLAIYDRFGRLLLGDEDQPKDVLEYLVIERHLVNPNGCWRLHGKIVPSWAPAKDPIIKTLMIPGPTLGPGEEFNALKYRVPKPEAVQ